MREEPEDRSVGREKRERKKGKKERKKGRKVEKQDVPRVVADTMDRVRFELTEGKGIGTDIVVESMERKAGDDPVKEAMERK